MATGQRVDPYAGFAFRVEVDGMFRGAFTDVGGLDTTIEVTEFTEGGDRHSRKLPGKVKGHFDSDFAFGVVGIVDSPKGSLEFVA